ncbi:MAG: glycosyltransferase [bacterium]
MKILFITYFFPPLGLAGVQRQSKLCKYLSKISWDITVVTSKPKWFLAYDHSLWDEVKSLISIIRIPSFDHYHLPLEKLFTTKSKYSSNRGLTKYGSSKFFSFPDYQVAWFFFSYPHIKRLVSGNKFDFVLVSAPPFSTFIISWAVSKFSGIPLIVDFRDPWIDQELFPFFSRFHRWFNLYWENKVLNQASLITTINPSIKKSIKQRFPQAKIYVLNQGYDPEDFKEKIKADSNSKLTITYMGSLIRGIKADVLLKAVECLIEQDNCWKHRLEIYFVGKNSKQAFNLASEMGISSLVRSVDYLPHREALQYARSADALWLYIPPWQGDNMSTGKLYDYLGTGNYIIASTLPTTAAAKLLSGYNKSYQVDPQDYQELSKVIENLYYQKQKSKKLPEDKSFIARFDRKLIAEKFSKVLLAGRVNSRQ